MNTDTNMIQFYDIEEEDSEGHFFVDEKKIYVSTIPLYFIDKFSKKDHNEMILYADSFYGLIKSKNVIEIFLTVTDPIFIRVFCQNPEENDVYKISFADYATFQQNYCKYSHHEQSSNWTIDGF